MFEEPIAAWLSSSIVKRAVDKNLVTPQILSILQELNHNHHLADDTPYGGGPGELLRIDVIEPMIEKALTTNSDIARKNKRVLIMDPAGKPFDQADAKRLSCYEELIFVCGRYEGIDARIHHYTDEAISVGDFVLSSGDIAAMAIFDATLRMRKGFLGNFDSITDESHQAHRLEASHYTRPSEYKGHGVPCALKSGDHKKIAQLKKLESIKKTIALRPDLIAKCPLDKNEESLLKDHIKASYPWNKYHE